MKEGILNDVVVPANEDGLMRQVHHLTVLHQVSNAYQGNARFIGWPPSAAIAESATLKVDGQELSLEITAEGK